MISLAYEINQLSAYFMQNPLATQTGDRVAYKKLCSTLVYHLGRNPPPSPTNTHPLIDPIPIILETRVCKTFALFLKISRKSFKL